MSRYLIILIGWLGLGAACVSEDPGLINLDESSLSPSHDIFGMYTGVGRPVASCDGGVVNGEWNLDCTSFPLSEEGNDKWQSYEADDDPGLRCEQDSLVRLLFRAFKPMEITQLEGVISMHYEYWGVVRTIHMDGQPPPPDTPHTIHGYSVGRWQGDTLVIETTHLAESFFRVTRGPVSDQARVVERYWPSPNGQDLLLDVMLDDPVYYTEPFILTRREWTWDPSAYINPWECVDQMDLFFGEQDLDAFFTEG